MIAVARCLIYTIPLWPHNHVSSTEYVYPVIHPGRSLVVSLDTRAGTISPVEQRAISFNEAVASESVPPTHPLSYPTEATVSADQALSHVYTKPNLSSSADLPDWPSTSSPANCASRRQSYRVARNNKSVVQLETYCCPPCHNVHHETTNDYPPPENVRSVPRPAFSFLVIALDWPHDSNASLPGVKDDLEWIKWILSGCDPAVALRTLTNGADATKPNIRLKILEMFREACPGTVIVLHFNGHGRGGSFLLYDFTRIDAVQLIKWINKIRLETGKHLTVCILFDHCRFDSSMPPPAFRLYKDIHMLWACLASQRSADFKMAGDDEARIPRSNLLKAICLLVDDVRTRCAHPSHCFMSLIGDWMHRVVQVMRAEECRMRRCWRPCASCSCLSYNRCSHAVTRSRHPAEESYPRVQSPDGMFWGSEDCVCVFRLFHLIEPAANPFLERMQETAGRIKAHKAYQVLDENGSYTWSTLWSILVLITRFVVSSVFLTFARFFAVKQPEPVAGPVRSLAGLPGESNAFQPANLPVQRGRDMSTVVALAPPLPS
ncbi:hypothetical protein BDV93DRAFT_522582 [Ceratobasidium sp. AG-I]|nr:hypothetical protein BDV93DRAFT_522582 [Ceratobasidium sp. AG-I]